MNVFLWVILTLFILDVLGKILMLKDRDFMRNPTCMVLDIWILLFLIIWTVALLVKGN